MLLTKEQLKRVANRNIHNHIDSDLIWAVQYENRIEVFTSWLISLSTDNAVAVKDLEVDLNK